jgi:hypothetical protein
MSLQSDKYLLFVSLCHKLCCETFFFFKLRNFSVYGEILVENVVII